MGRTTKTSGWRIGVIVVVTIASIGAWGCRRRAQRINDARMERYERNMLRLAERDTGCSAAQLSPQLIHANPRVYTVLGCAQPIEYWLECGHRNRRCRWREVPLLHETAAASLQCAPPMIRQEPTQSPVIRYASGCGRRVPFTMQCNTAACGWLQTGHAQATDGRVYVVPPDRTTQQPTPHPQPPPTPQAEAPEPAPDAPDASVQTQVERQREAVLSCIDSESVTLRLRWTADGRVIVQLPQELLGTAAEGCIQAAIGSLRVSADQAGEVVVPLE